MSDPLDPAATKERPGVGLNGKLICLCERNRTYCPHTEGQCPWWDREPIEPTWRRADEVLADV